MKRLLIVAGVLAGVAFVARRGAAHCKGMDFEAMIERMPDSAPPKWMFHNVSTIRQNTERILDLLEAESTKRAETRDRVPVS